MHVSECFDILGIPEDQIIEQQKMEDAGGAEPSTRIEEPGEEIDEAVPEATPIPQNASTPVMINGVTNGRERRKRKPTWKVEENEGIEIGKGKGRIGESHTKED